MFVVLCCVGRGLIVRYILSPSSGLPPKRWYLSMRPHFAANQKTNFDIFTAVELKSHTASLNNLGRNETLLWDFRFSRLRIWIWLHFGMLSRSLVEIDRRFRGIYYLNHQSNYGPDNGDKMYCETSTSFY
jgi:hypothetical protein